MSEQLLKLSPHRDLQCFFLTPTAIAAMSGASASGFTLSGTWRQQFDWAVVEWDRDNPYEHPSIRYLPDGDLSGLQLTYQETRTSCILFESNLYPTVDWPSLRLWATGSDGVEHVYFVPLANLASPVTPDYESASGTMTIQGTPQTGDRVGLTMPVAPAVTGYPEQHYYYQVQAGDSLQSIAAGLAANINAGSLDFTAAATGASVTLTWNGYEQTSGKTGANGNRITIYGFVSAGATESWVSPTITLTGGAFPTTYTVSIDFGNLSGYQDVSLTGTWMLVPTNSVRKMRWTWAADLQPGSFARTEYQVVVANWQVAGTGRQLYVAGPGSRRLEDNSNSVVYSGTWLAPAQGNYSGNWIHSTQQIGAAATFTYWQNELHSLYLGTQTVPDGATAQVAINNSTPQTFNLQTLGEQDLIRVPLGVFPAGSYTVTVTHDGPSDATLYIDFLEIAFPTANLQTPSENPQLALATDWDTYHSQALPAERTAWMIQQLGFGGRVNHYTGALWFYELVMPGHVYASAQVTFSMATPGGTGYTQLLVGPESLSTSQLTAITHYNLPDDTSTTVAEAFVCLINSGYTAIWASSAENVLTITSRAMTPIDASPSTTIAVVVASGTGSVAASTSAPSLTGGVPGTAYDDSVTEQYLTPYTQYWRTDLTAVPPINRAARDWSTAFFVALASYGIDVVASFSTELLNADPGVSANLAQRQSDGSPILVATPAVQTNFSPGSLAYWTQVYLDMAGLQAAAGVVPYLQFGEVQWWYFPSSQLTGVAVSMPFYDSYTTSQFEAAYRTSMAVIANEYADPSQFPNEVTLLSTLLGQQTASIRTALRSQYPSCRLEVLYPVDTNTTPDTNPIPTGESVHSPSLDELVNYPSSEWTPQNYNSLKTESFTYTYGRNLNDSLQAMEVSAQKGFPDGSRSHLIGISDATAAWVREVDLARSQGLESIVLFALDQFCLIGYPPPVLPQVRSLRLA
jgi:hypothetical protein